jgi:hypothetical protein
MIQPIKYKTSVTPKIYNILIYKKINKKLTNKLTKLTNKSTYYV